MDEGHRLFLQTSKRSVMRPRKIMTTIKLKETPVTVKPINGAIVGILGKKTQGGAGQVILCPDGLAREQRLVNLATG